jgi:hypothetical protein
VLAPLNLSGDQEGCTFADGEVTTPKGFKEAYDQYVAVAGKACRTRPNTAARACRCRWA